MDGNKNVTANFTRVNYTLSLTKTGNGSVKVNGALQSLPWSGQFPSETQVQLEAVPNSGWGFANWTGDLNSSVITTSINMNSNKNVTANFSLPLIGNLENPSNSQKVSGITTIHGWAIDGKKVTKVELYVNGAYAGDIPYGGSREDVRDVYPQYPNADLSGFGMIMNYSILSPGSYNIVVRLHNQDGQTKDLAATVTVVRFHGDFATQVFQIASGSIM